MALQLVKSTAFSITVNVSIPTEDPKKPLTGSFVATWKYLDRPAREELVERMSDGQIKDREFFDAHLISVSGIGGVGGETLTPEQQREAVWEQVELWQAATVAYWDHLTGAAAKNSKTSPRR